MVGTFVSNSHPWGRSGARVMAIFAFHVGPQLSCIGYFEAYWIFLSGDYANRYLRVSPVLDPTFNLFEHRQTNILQSVGCRSHVPPSFNMRSSLGLTGAPIDMIMVSGGPPKTN